VARVRAVACVVLGLSIPVGAALANDEAPAAEASRSAPDTHLGCPTPPDRTTLQLTSQLEAAERSYRDADVKGFVAAAEQIDAVLPCVAEVVPRSLIARVHRTNGMRAFVDRDPDAASDSFAGARAIEPDYAFPSDMVPEQHPMAKLYREAPETATTSPSPRPAEGSLLFDGRRTLDRPYTRDTLLQHVIDDAVVATYLLRPGQPTPEYPVWTEETAKKRGFGASKGLLIGAGVAALAAGGTYLAAGGQRAAYLDAPVEHKDALRSRTNALVVTSAGVGLAAVGLGTGAVLVGRW
jgi:hypothetical protein